MNTATIKTHSPLALAALGFILTIAGFAMATTASADPWTYARRGSYGTPSHTAVEGNVVDVLVKVDGASAPLFFKPSTSDRHYFQAYQGRNYSLVVRNTTGRRIGVVISVDGLNVVNGERSSLDRHEQMYVLDAWESAEIQGWRSSLDDVRRFVFVDEQRSYAERTGQANGDMGWIRVAAFREIEQQPWWGRVSPKQRPRRNDSRDSRDSRESYDGGAAAPQATNEAAPAPSMQDAPRGVGEMKAVPQSDLRSMTSKDMARDEVQQSAPGTGWGDRRYDPVQQTSFEPQKWAADQLTLRYEYAQGLQALGINLRRPRVFERERGELGFAQPPRW